MPCLHLSECPVRHVQRSRRADPDDARIWPHADRPEPAMDVRDGIEPCRAVVCHDRPFTGRAAGCKDSILVAEQFAASWPCEMVLDVSQPYLRIGDDAIPLIHERGLGENREVGQ